MDRLIKLAGILLGVAVAGTSLWSFFPRVGPNVDYIVGLTAFAIGVIAFFGIAGFDRSPDAQVFTGERLRTSIACALLLSYLFMVSFTTFVGNAMQVGPVTERFVDSFSSVVGITIAFYFGTSAATQIFAARSSSQAPPGAVTQD
jgi:hypothetical protein